MREIQCSRWLPRDRVAGADDENAAEESAVNRVAGDSDVARLHVRIAVVHDDAEVAVRIARIDSCVEQVVAADFAIVETVEVETLAVDLFELVVAVNGRSTLPAVSTATGMPGLRGRLLRRDSRSCGRDCFRRGSRSRGRSGWRRGRSWRIRCRRCGRARYGARCRANASRCRCRARWRCGNRGLRNRSCLLRAECRRWCYCACGVQAAAVGD